MLVSAVSLILGGRLLRLTYRYSVNIFFWDQWSFYDATLFQKHSRWEMFRWQYGPHRLGLGAALSSLVEPFFHWNSRTESFVALSVVVLATLCALWLKTLLWGKLAIPDLVIPIAYLSALQYESLFTNSDLAHGPLPLLLVTFYCLAWTVRHRTLRYVLLLVTNFVTIHTGFGVFLGFLTPLLIAFDYWRSRTEPRAGVFFVPALLAACVSIAYFFHGYTLQPAVDCFRLRAQNPFLYLSYVSLMCANFWTTGIGVFPHLVGAAVLLWFGWALVTAVSRMCKLSQPWVQNAISAVLLAYSLLFAFNAAVGRVCLGLASAQASRYTNYLALGILGAYLQLHTVRRPRLRTAMLSIAAAAFLATVPIRSHDRGMMRYFSEVKRNWRSCYLAGENIATCDSFAGFKMTPEPPELLEKKLEYLKEHQENLYAGKK